jgi:hypothetical protein
MFDPGRRMLRTYKRRVSLPEDDMYNSGLLSINDNAADPEQPPAPSGIWNKVQKWMTVPSSNLLRSFRVDSKTIAKNKQYQLLVLGQVMEGDTANEKCYNLLWNPEKSYLLTTEEREQRKKVGSFRVV